VGLRLKITPPFWLVAIKKILMHSQTHRHFFSAISSRRQAGNCGSTVISTKNLLRESCF